MTISGRAVMLSRLFRTADPAMEPQVEMNKSKPSGSVWNFLTREDRTTLAKVYEYAGSNGIDPLKVDNLAFDLACYRHSEGVLGYSGCDYDLTGQPITRSFKPADEAIAQRILTSKAINDTVIDQGFLRQALDPGYSATHAVDFEFLQQVVFAFSASGSDGAADPNAKPVIRPTAANFAPIKIEQPDDGKSLVQERLFGLTRSGERVAPEVNSPLLGYLTDMDKALLAGRYDEALKRGEGREGIEKVDKLALSLATQRWQQQMFSMLNDEGRKLKDSDNNPRLLQVRSTARDRLAAEAKNEPFNVRMTLLQSASDSTVTSSLAKYVSVNASVSPGGWRAHPWRSLEHITGNIAQGEYLAQAHLIQRDVLYLLALAMQAETANSTAADKPDMTAAEMATMFQPKDDSALKEVVDLVSYRSCLNPGESDLSGASTARARSGLTDAQFEQLQQVANDQRVQLRKIAAGIGMFYATTDKATTNRRTPGYEAVAKQPVVTSAASAPGDNQWLKENRPNGVFVRPSVTAKWSSLNLPSLTQPLQDYIDAKQSHISAELTDYLTQSKIPTMPSSISYDSEGKIQLPPNYQYVGGFMQALANKPSMEKELRIASALTSHLNAMMKNMPYQQNDAIAASLSDISAYSEKNISRKIVDPQSALAGSPRNLQDLSVANVLIEISKLLYDHKLMFNFDNYQTLFLNNADKVTISMDLQTDK